MIRAILTTGISEILLSNFQETVKSDEWSVREAVETPAVIIWLLALEAGRGARRAADGAAGGRRPRPSRSRAAPAPCARAGRSEPAQHAGDKRPVVKQKECWVRRFEAPAPLPAL